MAKRIITVKGEIFLRQMTARQCDTAQVRKKNYAFEPFWKESENNPRVQENIHPYPKEQADARPLHTCGSMLY